MLNKLKEYYKKYKLHRFIEKNKEKVLIKKNTSLMPSVNFKYYGRNNKVIIGEKCLIGCNFVFEADSGCIEIGDRVFIGGGTNLISVNKVEIGNDVLIAWDVFIYDHNAHSLNWETRVKDVELAWLKYNKMETGFEKEWDKVRSENIKICDKAWIGFGSLIMKGVTIGEGAIVGAKSVVTKDVEAWTVVAGNPAKVVKRLEI